MSKLWVWNSVRKRLEFVCRKPYSGISYKKHQKPDEATFRHKPSHIFGIGMKVEFWAKTRTFRPILNYSEPNLIFFTYITIKNRSSLFIAMLFRSKFFWNLLKNGLFILRIGRKPFKLTKNERKRHDFLSKATFRRIMNKSGF